MALKSLLIFLSTLVIALPGEPKQASDFQCVSGRRYQENKCNTCECINGELLSCSRNECDHLPFYDIAKNCTTGRKWKERCNRCRCLARYGTVCTIRNCEVRSKNIKKKLIFKGRTKGVLNTKSRTKQN